MFIAHVTGIMKREIDLDMQALIILHIRKYSLRDNQVERSREWIGILRICRSSQDFIVSSSINFSLPALVLAVVPACSLFCIVQ